MIKPATLFRSLRLLLAASLIWSAPGAAAHAAAASALRVAPAAPPSAAAVAPLVAAPGALSALATPLAAPIAPRVFAASLPPESPAPMPASPSAASSAEEPSPSRVARIFDGAVSGVQKLTSNVFATTEEAPDFETPAPAVARSRAKLSFSASAGREAALARIEMLSRELGFQPESADFKKKDGVIVTGTFPQHRFLALSVAPDVQDIHFMGNLPSPDQAPRLIAVAASLVRAVTPGTPGEPFVAATRRVAELEQLAKAEPAKAHLLAQQYIVSRKETRREVRLAALRVLDGVPLPRVLPFYTKLLTAYAEPPVQAAKASGTDSVWYIQRAILLRLAREAAVLQANPALIDLVRQHFADRNKSVRLAAGAALRAVGIDPGPENEYLDAAAPAPAVGAAQPHDVDVPSAPAPSQPEKKSFFQRWKRQIIAVVLSVSVAGGVYWGARLAMPTPQSHPAVVASATTTPPPAAASSAPTTPQESKDDAQIRLLQEIAKSQAQIAQAQAEQAAVARQAAAGSSGGFLSSIFGMVLNVVLFVGIYMLIMRFIQKRSGGGGASGPGGMTASTETKSEVQKPTQRLSDVEGADDALVDVQEVIEFMKDPAKFKRMGAKLPKGLLFVGPPGTGKTLLARAIAGETKAAYFAVSGSDFVELFVGMGARRVRELIAKAAGNKPAIIFIDEIDAVGKARGNGVNGSDSEREQTINALLTGMDGFDNSGGILFIAATNRADILDPALIRSGRFDRQVFVGKPHMGGREAIATIHAADKRLAPELDLAYMARRTAGLSGADIQNILNEAALQAIRRGADAIGMPDIDEAVDRGTIGAKRNLPIPQALKERIAYHEAGHVLANLLNPDPALRQKVNKFTIVPHGAGALGFAEMGSEEGDKYLYRREELEARIDHALGGLVAELLVYGKPESIPEEFSPNRRADWSTGPGSDLELATNVARHMVQKLGMGSETGLAVIAPDPRDPLGRQPFGDAVAEKSWREVNKILEASYKRVKERLKLNRHVLEALTQAVLAKETLIDAEIERAVSDAGPVYPPGEAASN
jgi:ATP-dependent metalloprotease FtsH